MPGFEYDLDPESGRGLMITAHGWLPQDWRRIAGELATKGWRITEQVWMLDQRTYYLLEAM